MNIPELISVEQDDEGNDVKVFQVKTLSMSPVYTYFLREVADSIDNGHGYPFTFWDDSKCGAIYSENENDITGVIVYSTMEKQKMLWLTFGSVSKNYRRKGIYRILRSAFEKYAKEEGCWGVASYIHKNNKEALAMAESLGAKTVFHYTVKKI